MFSRWIKWINGVLHIISLHRWRCFEKLTRNFHININQFIAQKYLCWYLFLKHYHNSLYVACQQLTTQGVVYWIFASSFYLRPISQKIFCWQLHFNGKFTLLHAITNHQITIFYVFHNNPDSKVHGANMGAIWGRQDPGGPHVGPMNFAIWEHSCCAMCKCFHGRCLRH